MPYNVLLPVNTLTAISNWRVVTWLLLTAGCR